MIIESFYLKPEGCEDEIYIEVHGSSKGYTDNREKILKALAEIGELKP